MSTDTPNFEIYFSLIEKRGEKTDQLIKEIVRVTKELDVYEHVTFAGTLSATNASSSDNKLVYCIEVPTISSAKGAAIIAFLSYVFEKMFDKFPAFTEPDAL